MYDRTGPYRMNLKEWLSYDSDTGFLHWIKKPKSRYNIKIGDKAGSNHSQGYTQVKIKGKVYLAHRVGWFFYFGYWPAQLDHINGDRRDNRIKNLREVNYSQNQQNNKGQVNKTSRFKGVSWCKNRNKWCSFIKVNKKTFNLGRYNDETIAAIKYNEAAMKYFGNYAKINEVV